MVKKDQPATIASAKAKAPKSPTSKEDRTGHRVPINLLVDYRSGGTYLFDFCKDLGTGGVFIESKTPLPQGAPIELTFTLPDSKETLKAKGQVIWSQPAVPGRDDLNCGMGVQFVEFTNEQRGQLAEFVRRYHGDKLTGKKSA